MGARALRGDLAGRFVARLAARGRPAAGERVVVSVSGGVDSVVLLHLLRFAAGAPRLDLTVAHFDHGMRPGSAEDADWVAALARSWEVPSERGAAGALLASERAARDARYAFLESVRARVGARWILTAHHADDQAETVLFRIARGTGLPGLRGIPARRGALLRPLLPFWKEEIAGYAAEHGLGFRTDPTNASRRFARNALRLDVIPALARSVAPGTRESLVRLARLAAREEAAWRSLLPGLIAAVVTERSEARVVVARDALLAQSRPVRARVLRGLLPRGTSLDDVGTTELLSFTESAESGRVHRLKDDVSLVREFDRFVLARGAPVPGDRPLDIPDWGAGEGSCEIGGRRLGVRWSLEAAAPPPAGEREAFALERIVFPLRLRSPLAGDRIGLPYGSKKLKKLLGEARIPSSERRRIPVLVDGTGRVLWMPGIARDAGTLPAPGGATLHIGVRDVGEAGIG